MRRLLTVIILLTGLFLQSCKKNVNGIDNNKPSTDPVETATLKYIPDSVFRIYLKANICPNAFDKTGKFIDITNSEVKNFNGTIQIDTVTCQKPYVVSLKGIEYFTKMKKLIVEDSPVDSLSLTATMELDTIRLMRDRDLQYAIFSGCTGMEYIRLGDIPATSVNLSNLPELNYVNLISLKRLSDLKTDNDAKLQHLMTYGLTSLKTVNVSTNTNLRRLFLEACTNFTSLDITHNPKLKHFKATYFPVKNIDFSKCDSLATVQFEDSDIDTVDFSHNPQLFAIVMMRTKIRNLGLLANPKVCQLWLDGSGYLQNLDLRAQKNFDIWYVPAANYLSMGEDNYNQVYQEGLISPVQTAQHTGFNPATRDGVNGAVGNYYGGLRVPNYLDGNGLVLAQVKVNKRIKDNYSLVMARRVLASMTPVLVTVYEDDMSTVVCPDYDPTLFKCN